MPFSEIGHLTKENMSQSSTSQWRVLKVGLLCADRCGEGK